MRILLIVGAILFCNAVAAQLPPPPTELTLGWDIPTERTDDTPLSLSEIAGYELISNCLSEVFKVDNPEQTSVTFALDTSLSCDWQIQTVDTTGIRSAPSNAVTVEFKTPKAPVLRRVSF